jgi:hypothetical protein
MQPTTIEVEPMRWLTAKRGELTMRLTAKSGEPTVRLTAKRSEPTTHHPGICIIAY